MCTDGICRRICSRPCQRRRPAAAANLTALTVATSPATSDAPVIPLVFTNPASTLTVSAAPIERRACA